MISGDALTDIDLAALAARHRDAAGSRRWRSRRCRTRASTASCCTTATGGSPAFRRSPLPEEALSDLGNCGIYVFDPKIFDYFPERPFVDWAQDVFPALLENDVPFHIHEMREYWNDVGSLAELRQGTFDALRGELRLEIEGEEVEPGRDRRRRAGASPLREDAEIEGPAWIGPRRHDRRAACG